MENATATVETKRITWEDFTLEEHIQAYMGGLPKDCILKVNLVVEESENRKIYRVNMFNPKTEIFVKSDAVRVTTTPEGYIFEPWNVKEEKGKK